MATTDACFQTPFSATAPNKWKALKCEVLKPTTTETSFETRLLESTRTDCFDPHNIQSPNPP